MVFPLRWRLSDLPIPYGSRRRGWRRRRSWRVGRERRPFLYRHGPEDQVQGFRRHGAVRRDGGHHDHDRTGKDHRGRYEDHGRALRLPRLADDAGKTLVRGNLAAENLELAFDTGECRLRGISRLEEFRHLYLGELLQCLRIRLS